MEVEKKQRMKIVSFAVSESDLQTARFWVGII